MHKQWPYVYESRHMWVLKNQKFGIFYGDQKSYRVYKRAWFMTSPSGMQQSSTCHHTITSGYLVADQVDFVHWFLSLSEESTPLSRRHLCCSKLSKQSSTSTSASTLSTVTTKTILFFASNKRGRSEIRWNCWQQKVFSAPFKTNLALRGFQVKRITTRLGRKKFKHTIIRSLLFRIYWKDEKTVIVLIENY